MFKKTMKRFITLTLAMMMVMSLVPQSAFAASGQLDGLYDSSINLNYSDGDWKAMGTTITGSVTGKAKTSCESAKSSSSVLTIKNNRSTPALIAFSYTVIRNGGTVQVDGETATADNKEIKFQKELAVGGTVTINLESDVGNKTTYIQIDKITLTADIETVSIFEPAENGSYTVDDVKITESKQLTKNAKEGYNVSAVPSSGCKFKGWYSITDKKYLSTDAMTNLKLETSQSIKPVFIAASIPVFKVRDNLFEDLTEAVIYAQTSKINKVVLASDGVLAAGNYDIPSGITLLIPFDVTETCYTTVPESAAVSTRKAYRTLTMGKGAHIDVNGALSISAKHSNVQGTNGSPVGAYGYIKMDEGSSITVKNGGALYAWGYISGSGKVDVKAGGAVYEDFQIMDWRGGSATSGMVGRQVFPISQYYVQNIEVPLSLEYGAKEVTNTSVTASGKVYNADINFVGSGSMFIMSEGTVITKMYDPSVDRMIFEISGDVELGSISLSALGQKVDSAEYVLPINSNITLNMKSGNFIAKNNAELLPGVIINIAEDAALNIVTGKSVYVYDYEDWGAYVSIGKKLAPIAYSPTKKYTRTEKDLTDACINLNGNLNLNGSLYTTQNGANIISSDGSGRITMINDAGASTNTKQVTQSGTSISYVDVAITSAQLYNTDGSYTQTAEAKAGDIYAYYDGEWYKTHKIIWQDENGKELQSEEHLFRGTDTAYSGEIPQKDADAQNTYTFAGWKDSAGNTIDAGVSVAVTKDETYTAVFNSKLNEYTVIWKDGDGEIIKTESLEYGTIPQYSGDTPTKTQTPQYNYVFNDNWSPEIESVTGNAEYTAQFDAVTRTYTVIWKNDNGTILDTDENVPYGTLPSYDGNVPEKDKTAQYTYTFKEWDKEISEVTGDVTYTAVFDSTVNEYEITWNTGREVIKETLAYGAEIAYKGSEPVKDDEPEFTYKFDKWTDSTGAALAAGAKVTDNAEYTAQFTSARRSYTVTWKNGDSEQSEILEYGTPISYKGNTPEKESTIDKTFAFSGWKTEDGTELAEGDTVKGNVTYIAQYDEAVRQYTVTWKNEDAVIKEEKVNYGEIPEYTGEIPAKTSTDEFNYTFSGWGEIKAVSGDAVYEAQFASARRSYMVTWKNGDSEQNETLEYGTLISYKGNTPEKESTIDKTFVFSGWKTEDGIELAEGDTVKGNITYIAQYDEAVRQYTVTWKNENIVIKEEKVNYGELPQYTGEVPIKESTVEFNYTFDGWGEIEAVSGDAVYEAQFKAETRSYDIAWYDEDGTSLLSTTRVKYGEIPVFDKAEPSKEKTAQYTYKFAGWTTSDDNTITGIAAVTGEVSYRAVYTAIVNKYTVTWVNWNGEELEKDETVEYGTKPSYSGETPVKADDIDKVYTFSGWGITDETIVTGDVTYRAQFTADTRKYEIIWKNEDGTELFKESVAYGETPVYGGETPAKASTEEFRYEFKGWTSEVASVTGDAVYTAAFEAITREYTVTWLDEDGETVLGTTTVKYGVMPVYGEIPSKDSTAQYDYKFVGWTTELKEVTGDVSYTAKFTAEERSYTVLWLDEDGSELERDENIVYGTMPEYNGAEPAKEADAQYTYEFAGWNAEISKVTGDVTYTAVYKGTLNEYTVIWANWNGDELERDENVPYGTMPSYNSAEPVKDEDAQYSYRFMGWDKTISEVTGDVTYTAQFANSEAKMYMITWLDEDCETILYKSEAAYGTVPVYGGAEPVKEGNAQYTYTFSGWSPEVVEVTGDAIYIAQYSDSINSYTVTWLDEDGTTVLARESFAYGTMPEYTGEIPVKADFENYIYTFDGWTEEVSEVKGNASYTAKYEAHILGAPENENLVSATCTEDGAYDIVVRCTICHKEFSRETVKIDAFGHKLEFTQADEDDCIIGEEGEYTEYFKCIACGKCFEDEEGLTEITVINHEYSINIKSELSCETDGVTEYICTRCGHKYEITVPATGHRYTAPEWIWTDDNTASAVFRCENENCDGEWIEEAEITWENVEATCTGEEAVSYPLAAVTFNGETYKDTNGEVPSPSGHTYGEPEWIWDGYGSEVAVFVCRSGDDVKEIEASVTSEVLIEMNCDEALKTDGLVRYTATAEFNGQIYRETRDEKIPAEHSFGERSIIKEATCTMPGEYEEKCEICEFVQRGNTELKAHTPVTDPRKEPTYDETGLTEGSHCGECGTVLVAQNIIDKLTKPAGPSGGGGGGGGAVAPVTPPADDTETITDEKTPLADKPFMFEDVTEDIWYYESVKYVFTNDFMEGTSETLFSPNADLNRAMIVTIVYRLEGKPNVTGTSKFSDVKSGMWYSDAIAWAEANGIVKGKSEETFAPAESITREQFAAILYRYAQYKKYDVTSSGSLGAFTDNEMVTEYAREAVSWSIGAKIINGKEDAKIDPKGKATRSEAAAMITRFCETYQSADTEKKDDKKADAAK